MGSWNETCVLTRTPISAGMPVVKLSTVTGPAYKGQFDYGGKTSLLFGMPEFGRYDDYGSIEQPETPQAAALMEAAFKKSGLYRSAVTVRGVTNTPHMRWVANCAGALTAERNQLLRLFYAAHGLKFSDEDSYDDDVRAKLRQAEVDYENALAQLGRSLGIYEYPDADQAFMDGLFAMVGSAFGEGNAWAAWSALTQGGGLFARRGHMLMHRAAYEAVVKDFSQRSVRSSTSNTRSSVRDFLSARLDRFFEENSKLRETHAQAEAAAPAQLLEVMRQTNARIRQLRLNDPYLLPLTHPWHCSLVPVEGFFWGGATSDEILAVHSREALLDYMVFSWGRSYLRVDLVPPNAGSQCRESTLHHNMMEAAYAALKSHRMLREDFDGIVMD